METNRIAMFALMAGAVCAMQGPDPKRTFLETQNLVIRDELGKIRASLGTVPGGGPVQFKIFDSDGETERIQLSASKTQTEILLRTPDASGLVSLFIDSNSSRIDIAAGGGARCNLSGTAVTGSMSLSKADTMEINGVKQKTSTTIYHVP